MRDRRPLADLIEGTVDEVEGHGDDSGVVGVLQLALCYRQQRCFLAPKALFIETRLFVWTEGRRDQENTSVFGHDTSCESLKSQNAA